MKIISPWWKFEDEEIECPRYETKYHYHGDDLLAKLEKYGRTCYKSEDKITIDSAAKFVQMIIKNGHESVLEHEKITVRVICDRGVSHEIVRHRIASYSQESTRYCNYGNSKEITVILPIWYQIAYETFNDLILKGYTKDAAIGKMHAENLPLNSGTRFYHWYTACQTAENSYMELLQHNANPQEARSVLPNSLKTEIVITFNIREWRHFFRLRTSSKAHPQMREITIPMLERFKKTFLIVFDDIFVGGEGE